MKNIKYKAKKGARLSDRKAQIFGERIEYLTNGMRRGIQPVDLIQDGQSKKSPFHTYFEWNDKVAGHEHRLHQARYVLHSIVQEVHIKGVPHDQRSFFCVKDVKTDENIYITVEKAVNNPTHRTELLNKMIAQLESITLTMKLFRQYE